MAPTVAARACHGSGGMPRRDFLYCTPFGAGDAMEWEEMRHAGKRDMRGSEGWDTKTVDGKRKPRRRLLYYA